MRKETKAAPASGGDALLRAFEEFKAANDARLDAIERKRGDVLLEEKVDRIDRALAEQKSLIERAALAGRRPGMAADAAVSEHKSAWHAYLRRGDVSALAQFEAKALSAGSDPDGGYVAPPELDRMIEARLKQVSPMRSVATVRTTGANVFKKPISLTAAGTGWISETGARTQTTTPTLAMLEFPTAELYANLAATQTLLDDSFVNLEEWIAAEVEEAFAGQERAAFVIGDGDDKPRGFLDYDLVAEGSHVWGKIGYIATGVDGGFAAEAPVDDLIDLIYTPKTQFRQNARFVMNRKTVSSVRKLKDGDDRYICVCDRGGRRMGNRAGAYLYAGRTERIRTLRLLAWAFGISPCYARAASGRRAHRAARRTSRANRHRGARMGRGAEVCGAARWRHRRRSARRGAVFGSAPHRSSSVGAG